MAKFGPLTNALVKINNVDLSNRVESVTLSLSKDDVDVTAMGEGGHTHVGGLENDKLSVSFWQDWAASSVDATLMPIFQAGTAVSFTIGPAGTTAGTVYTGSCVLLEYQPIGGKVGDGLLAPVNFSVSGTVTRGTQ